MANQDYYDEYFDLEKRQKRKKVIGLIIFISIIIFIVHLLWAVNFENPEVPIESKIDLNAANDYSQNSETTEIKDIAYLNDNEMVYSRGKYIGSTPANWPTSGGYISSHFGYRKSIFSKQNISYHQGIDICVNYGSPVYSTGSGIVEFAGFRGNYGYTVVINHKNGYHTLYAHCSKLLVQVNQVIQSGQLIAKVGATGSATGAHLHYEVRLRNMPINPMAYIGSYNKEYRSRELQVTRRIK